MTSDKLENANIIACGIELNWRRIGFAFGVWDDTVFGWWVGNKSGSLIQQHESVTSVYIHGIVVLRNDIP